MENSVLLFLQHYILKQDTRVTSNTPADLWASPAARLLSPAEPRAHFLCPPLDHMEHEGHRDALYHTLVCVCQRVQECV